MSRAVKSLLLLLACTVVGCSNPLGEDRVFPFFSHEHTLELGDTVSLDEAFHPDEKAALEAELQKRGYLVGKGNWQVIRGRPDYGNFDQTKQAWYVRDGEKIWVNSEGLTVSQQVAWFGAMIDIVEEPPGS